MLPRNDGDIISWFEQAASKNKVQHNTVSSPCDTKAQTVAVSILFYNMAEAECKCIFPYHSLSFGMGFFILLKVKEVVRMDSGGSHERYNISAEGTDEVPESPGVDQISILRLPGWFCNLKF